MYRPVVDVNKPHPGPTGLMTEFPYRGGSHE
jgi:hypothetical protein